MIEVFVILTHLGYVRTCMHNNLILGFSARALYLLSCLFVAVDDNVVYTSTRRSTHVEHNSIPYKKEVSTVGHAAVCCHPYNTSFLVQWLCTPAAVCSILTYISRWLGVARKKTVRYITYMHPKRCDIKI